MKRIISIVMPLLIMATNAVYAADEVPDFVNVMAKQLWGIACIIVAAGAFIYALREITKGSFTKRSIIAMLIFIAFTLIGFGLI